jgi:hypothetical protein
MGIELQRSEITLIFDVAPPELFENIFRFSINKMLLRSIILKSIFLFFIQYTLALPHPKFFRKTYSTQRAASRAVA